MKDRPVVMAICAFALVALNGCGSSPATHFYALDAVRPNREGALAMKAAVQVAAVHIPAMLDRREVVRERAAYTVDVSGQNRWAAPLDEMVRRVLSEDLTQRVGSVLPPNAPAGKSAARIVVTLEQFGRGPSGMVRLDGVWTLLGPGSEQPVLTRPVHLKEETEGKGYGDDAAAMSRALGRLADDIAAKVRDAANAG